MEAFAALGLAANIAQFLELGAKIFKNAKEIKDAGSTVSTSHLATLAADIDDLSSGIRHQYTSLLPNSHSEEKALCDLASRCSEAADDLTAVLKSTIQSSSKKTTWDSTVAALRMIWHQDRINALGERLSEYRGQLTLRLLMVLNKQQSRGLESVRDDIVEVISVNIRDLVAAVGQGKDETIAAIFKTRSGSSTAISRPAGLNPTKDDSLRTSITYTHDTEATGSGSADVARFQTVTGIENYGQKIMDALHFRGISERRSTILPAHEETFEWVWDDSSHPDVKDVKWDPLGTWLRESNPAKGMCYWTSGKAGSGKSSLLKYAQQDPRLAAYLRDWAGSAQLVISSFYFWYAGTDLQKSHAGLLRALLLDVLNSRPDMAAVLFPDICRAIISGRLEGFLELSLWELKAAFSNLVRSVPHDMRIFFIVDGIDEYVGDYNELCKLLLEATASTSVKALVSSRPISACCDRFRHCPSLRMQDLTRHDIQRYVTDNLGNHHLMTKMEKIEPGVTIKIVDEVVDRASGVFLWIVLVVRNLVLRLQNYDSSATLLKEVARLPPDLEKLYGHMLSSMSKENQILGSKFLQMLLRHMEIGCNYPFTLLQLSFAEENDYEACLKTPFKALAAEVSEWRCEATAGRLRASCCGLCEVQNSPGQSEPWVGFFHRTVVEFLQLDGVWEKVTLLTSNPSLTHSSYFEFDADLALVSSSVAELKAMALQPWHRKGPDKSSDIFLRMLRMLGYEKHLNERVRLAYHDRYLNEMRRAVTYHWHNPEIFPSPEQEAAAVDRSCDRARRQLKLDYPHSIILALGIQAADSRLYSETCNMHTYSMHAVPHTNTFANAKLQHLDAAYLMIHMVDEPQGNVRLLMANAFGNCRTVPTESISIPAGPAKKLWNDRWKSAGSQPWSLWEFILHYCYSIMNGTENSGVDFLVPAISRSLLITISGLLRCFGLVSNESGIVVVTGHTGRKRETLSSKSVIMPVLNRIWSKAEDYSASEKFEVADLSSMIEKWLNSDAAELSSIDEPMLKQSKGPEHHIEPQDLPTGSKKRHQALRFIIAFGMLSKASSATRRRARPLSGNSSSTLREPASTTSPQSQSGSSYDPKFTSPWLAYRSQTWSTTDRTRRIELLPPDQQQLVRDLANPNQREKERRQSSMHLSGLPLGRRQEVLDCVEVIDPESWYLKEKKKRTGIR